MSSVRKITDILSLSNDFPKNISLKFNSVPNNFSTNQLIVAANWWAKYLPQMNNNISFDEIARNADLNKNLNIYRANFETGKKLQNPISPDQYNYFIQILVEKMKMLPIKSENGLPYIQLGNRLRYDPPEILEEAVKGSGIQIGDIGLFPWQVDMKIYSNGHIKVDDEIISTNPLVTHYDLDTVQANLTAPSLKISGHPFRIIEIPLYHLKNDLFSGKINELKTFNPNILKGRYDRSSKSFNMAYVQIFLADFKGNEEEFLKLSNDDFISILQNPSQLRLLFKDNTFLYYKNNKEIFLKETFLIGFGHVTPEPLTFNYYQYTTGVVKTLPVLQEGTISFGNELYPVYPNDILIYRGDRNYLSCLSKNDLFVARLCNNEGHILSDSVIRSGNDLLLMKQQEICPVSQSVLSSQLKCVP